jgi:hypothetical protein
MTSGVLLGTSRDDDTPAFSQSSLLKEFAVMACGPNLAAIPDRAGPGEGTVNRGKHSVPAILGHKAVALTGLDHGGYELIPRDDPVVCPATHQAHQPKRGRVTPTIWRHGRKRG